MDVREKKSQRMEFMRTLKEVEADIEFVKRDIAECRKNHYSTVNAYEDLLELYAEKRAIIENNDFYGSMIDGCDD